MFTNLQAHKESLANNTAWLLGLSHLLLEKHIITEEELLTAIALGKEEVDRDRDERREKELNRLTLHPDGED